jgi:hypothetical protein
MIDFDLRFRMTRRSAALTHEEPPTSRLRNLFVLAAIVLVLLVAYWVLGITPEKLLDLLA